MTDEDRVTMMAAGAIMQIADALPLDLALSALRSVVADIIRSSHEPAALWAALASGVEINSKLQHRFVSNAPQRTQ